MLTDSHHESQICSCTSCFYESQSCDPSVQQILRDGSKIDRLYLGKYIPLRERNLLKKLVRTRAVYDDINCQLVAKTCVDATYFIPRQHEIQRHTRLGDNKRNSSLLEIIGRKKRSPHNHHHLMEHCSCCTCGAIHAKKYHKKQRRHRYHDHPHGGFSTSVMGRGRRSVRFKAKPIQSEPCTCATKRNEMLRRYTRNIKIRPEYQIIERPIYFPVDENVHSSNEKKHRKHYIQNYKTSKLQLMQNERYREPKGKENRKIGESKVNGSKKTETGKSLAVQKSLKTREEPYQSYGLDETSFSIKKDLLAMFKDENEERRKQYFIKYINKYKPCKSTSPGCCYPGECDPSECCKMMERRRHQKRQRKKGRHWHEYTSKKKHERHDKIVDILSTAQKVTSRTPIENAISKASSISSQKSRKKPISELSFEKNYSPQNNDDVMPINENIIDKSSSNKRAKTSNKKKNKRGSKEQHVGKSGSRKTLIGSLLVGVDKTRKNHRKNMIIKHRTSQTLFEKNPNRNDRSFQKCLCILKLHPKVTKKRHPKSTFNDTRIIPQHKVFSELIIYDNDVVDINVGSKNIATQSSSIRKKIDDHHQSSSHYKNKIEVEPKAAIIRKNLIYCKCANQDDKKNFSDTLQTKKDRLISEMKSVPSKNTKFNKPRLKLPQLRIFTKQPDYKVKKHRLRRCFCTLKLAKRWSKNYQFLQNEFVSGVCDPSHCLDLNKGIQKQHPQRYMKRSMREYRKTKSTSSFMFSTKSNKPKKVQSSFYPSSRQHERKSPGSITITSDSQGQQIKGFNEVSPEILKKGDYHRKSTSNLIKPKNKSKFILPSAKKCLCVIQQPSNILKPSLSNKASKGTKFSSKKHKTTTTSQKLKTEKLVLGPLYKSNFFCDPHQCLKGLRGGNLQKRMSGSSKLKSNSTFSYKSRQKSKGTLAKSIVTQQQHKTFPTPKRIVKYKKAIPPVVDLKIPRQIVRYGSNISFSIEFSKYTYNKNHL